jgi:hypothetical protein
MTLKSFLASGFDLGEGKVLVCVRSVGPRRTIHPKKREGTIDLVEVGIYDDTANGVLKLWEDKIPSAKLVSNSRCHFIPIPVTFQSTSPLLEIASYLTSPACS